MSTYKVTALVSLYKAERFIRGRLDDLTQQTLFKRGELEIVIIDSASPENEFETIREFCDKYESIKYKRTKVRESLYRAWNRGIEVSNAPLLTNANADDRLCPDALEKLADALDSHHEAGFAYGDAYLSSIENQTFEDVRKDSIFRSPDYFGPELLCHQFLGHQVMWRRSLHSQVGPFSSEFRAAGDYDFMLRGATRANGVHVCEPLGLLLRRRDSITFSDGTMDREVALVKSHYRNPEHALELYKIEGVDVEKPGYSEACFIDLGNRALSYFPQWRDGRPDADFDFAQMCYRWALESASKDSESEMVRVWAKNNLKAAHVLSGSSIEGEVDLVWPNLGAREFSDCRRSVLGPFSEKETTLDKKLAYRKYSVAPLFYWSQLIGFEQETMDTLMSHIEVNQEIMIWGAGARGLLMAKVFDQQGLKIAGFIDNDSSKAGNLLGNLPIVGFDPSEALENGWKVILAVSEQQRGFILEQLDDCGMRGILIQI